MKKKPILFITSSSNLETILLDILSDIYNMIKIKPIDLKIKDLKLYKPELIIIDDKEFKEDIYLIIQGIRNLKEFQFTPILTISKHLKKTYIDALKKYGVTDCIFEPISQEVLLNKIKETKQIKTTETKLHSISTLMNPLSSEVSSLDSRLFLNKTIMNPILDTFKKNIPFCTTLLQIDHLETLYSKYSTHVLKDLLAHITSIINDNFSYKGRIFSLGHGKFLTILTGLDKNTIYSLCNNLQEAIKTTPFTNNAIGIPTTISIGIAFKDGTQFKSINEMISRAKQALIISLDIADHISFSK